MYVVYIKFWHNFKQPSKETNIWIPLTFRLNTSLNNNLFFCPISLNRPSQFRRIQNSVVEFKGKMWVQQPLSIRRYFTARLHIRYACDGDIATDAFFRISILAWPFVTDLRLNLSPFGSFFCGGHIASQCRFQNHPFHQHDFLFASYKDKTHLKSIHHWYRLYKSWQICHFTYLVQEVWWELSSQD